MTKQEHRCIALAKQAVANAYAPYSHFAVGACVMCRDGRFFQGANIENASYGLTNCAERSALFAAYSNGLRQTDICCMAIAAKQAKPISPCGACRQVMAELLTADTPVFLIGEQEVRQVRVSELLPNAFSKEALL